MDAEPRFARTLTLFAVVAVLALIAMLRTASANDELTNERPVVLPFE